MKLSIAAVSIALLTYAATASAQYYRQPPPPQPGGGPATMKYRDGDPIPAGYHPEERVRTGFVVAGSITLGVGYLPALSVAMSSNLSADHWLFVPAIGPWMDLGARPRCQTGNSDTGCLGEALYDILLVWDGIAQTTGAVLLLVGVASPKTVLVRNDMASSSPPRAHVSIAPRPMGHGGFGLALSGDFL